VGNGTLGESGFSSDMADRDRRRAIALDHPPQGLHEFDPAFIMIDDLWHQFPLS
jgi:hypothetical protein